MKIRERQRKINKTKNWLFEKDQWSLQASNKTDGRRRWHPTPVLLPGKSHGRRSLVGCSPWGSRRVGHNWATSLSFSLSCIGEGNGNQLQCSCLENPRDRGDWWAAIYGVAQSRTRLKRLSSSSSSSSRPLTNLENDRNLQIKEAEKTLSKMSPKKSTLGQTIDKLLETKENCYLLFFSKVIHVK